LGTPPLRSVVFAGDVSRVLSAREQPIASATVAAAVMSLMGVRISLSSRAEVALSRACGARRMLHARCHFAGDLDEVSEG
jgi:hypothetical protein